MSPGKIEDKQSKFVELCPLWKGYFIEMYKSPNINPISPSPKFAFGIIHIIIKSLSNLSKQFQYLTFQTKIESEYDQEIPQSQTADNPMAPRGRGAQPSRDTRETNKQSNQLSLPH